MLAQGCQFFEHGNTTLRVGKGISIISKLNGLERSVVSKLLKIKQDVFRGSTRRPYVSPARIAVPAAKLAGLANRDEHAILLHSKQNAFSHVSFLYFPG